MLCQRTARQAAPPLADRLIEGVLLQAYREHNGQWGGPQAAPERQAGPIHCSDSLYSDAQGCCSTFSVVPRPGACLPMHGCPRLACASPASAADLSRCSRRVASSWWSCLEPLIAMALSLRCRDCSAQLRSVAEVGSLGSAVAEAAQVSDWCNLVPRLRLTETRPGTATSRSPQKRRVLQQAAARCKLEVK